MFSEGQLPMIRITDNILVRKGSQTSNIHIIDTNIQDVAKRSLNIDVRSTGSIIFYQKNNVMS